MATVVPAALSAKNVRPLPWMMVRNASDESFRLRLIERAIDSSARPCDMGGKGAVKTLLRSGMAKEKQSQSYGAEAASGELETHEVQNLADQIDALRGATAGHHFRIRVTVEIGEGGKVDQAVLDKVNALLGRVKAGWHTP